MNWISVKDKLPSGCEIVLIYCALIKQIAIGYLIYDSKREPIVIVAFDEYDQPASLEDITHWMPIPEVPNGVD